MVSNPASRVIVAPVHVVETRHVRRFVVRIEPGEDVVASLEKLAKSELFRAGWARGRGVVAWADIATWDDAARAWKAARHLEGPLSLTSLDGTFTTRLGEPTLEIEASFSREAGSIGGRLVAAAALSVEILVEVFDDVRLERQEDDALGMAVWRADRTPGVVARPRTPRSESPPVRVLPRPVSEAPAAEPPPSVPAPAASGAALSWAAVAEASAEQTSRAVASPSTRPANQAPSFLAKPTTAKVADEPQHTPQRGDWVEHRQFGLCKVEGEDPDGGTRVRLPSGARKTLRLDVMEVLAPRHEADRTVFPVRPRTR